MSTQTPFELRLAMLQMAKDYLDRQSDIARDATRANWENVVNFARDMKFEAPIAPIDMTKTYSIDDIVEMANKFNAFVSGKQ